MTKDEIKRELDALGIDYQKDAKIADLEALYAPYANHGTVDGAAVRGEAGQAAPAEDTPNAESDNRTVSAVTDVNVREDPSMEARVLCVAKQGAVLEIGEGTAEGWTPVVLHAWVKSEFLEN